MTRYESSKILFRRTLISNLFGTLFCEKITKIVNNTYKNYYYNFQKLQKFLKLYKKKLKIIIKIIKHIKIIVKIENLEKVFCNKSLYSYRFSKLRFHKLIFPLIIARIRNCWPGYLRIGQAWILPLSCPGVYKKIKNLN